MNRILNFDFQSVAKVTETKKGKAIISGTLLVEGLSKNGNLYSIEEMKGIAKRTVGKPLYYGVTTKINPNTGLLCKNLHDNNEENRIGKILRTIWSKTKRKVRFIAEVWNTATHPNLINRLKSGFGVSIGGYVVNAVRSFDRLLRRNILKIKDLVVEHVQIVPPSVVRGQDEAKIEDIEIQETMVFRSPKSQRILNLAEISSIVLKELGEL